MPPYRRVYVGGTDEYTPTGRTVEVGYTIIGMDGESVRGTFDAGLLSDNDLNYLCDALKKAGSFLPWASYIDVRVVESGKRSFFVEDENPPENP